LEILTDSGEGQAQFSRVLQNVIILGIVGLEGEEDSRRITESDGGDEFLKAKALDGKGSQFPSRGEGDLDIKVRLVKAGERRLESGGWGRSCVNCSRGSGRMGLGGCASGGGLGSSSGGGQGSGSGGSLLGGSRSS